MIKLLIWWIWSCSNETHLIWENYFWTETDGSQLPVINSIVRIVFPTLNLPKVAMDSGDEKQFLDRRILGAAVAWLIITNIRFYCWLRTRQLLIVRFTSRGEQQARNKLKSRRNQNFVIEHWNYSVINCAENCYWNMTYLLSLLKLIVLNIHEIRWSMWKVKITMDRPIIRKLCQKLRSKITWKSTRSHETK